MPHESPADRIAQKYSFPEHLKSPGQEQPQGEPETKKESLASKLARGRYARPGRVKRG